MQFSYDTTEEELGCAQLKDPKRNSLRALLDYRSFGLAAAMATSYSHDIAAE